MVYLYSTISGFRTILGSVTIQAAMLIILLIFVEVPQQSYSTSDPYAGENEKMEHILKKLWGQMVLTHLVSVVII